MNPFNSFRTFTSGLCLLLLVVMPKSSNVNVVFILFDPVLLKLGSLIVVAVFALLLSSAGKSLRLLFLGKLLSSLTTFVSCVIGFDVFLASLDDLSLALAYK
mgnify:CR=1 FL=1